jgi:hypothetical protein
VRRHRRATGRIAAAAVLVAAVAFRGWTEIRPGSATVPRLPVLSTGHVVYDHDFGDPFVLATTPGYVLFGTDDPPDHVPTATSPDLHTWTPGPDAVPVLPSWAGPDPDDSLTWAPAALATPGGYRLYVTVPDAATKRQCIAVLRSPTPLGPYADAIGHPLVCQAALGGSIDPSVAADGGRLSLVWKSDGNCCGLPASLWAQALRSDGLAVTGAPHRLLTADRAWQGGVIENPAVLRASSGWWLFYSGNRFDNAAYATGLAWCPSLAGPCRETANRPFLAGNSVDAGQFSAGGLDFLRGPGGQVLAAFATWNRPPRHGRFFCCHSLDIASVLSH